MVNMSHDCDDGGTSFEVFLFVFLFFNSIGHFARYVLCGETKLLSHDIDGFGIQTLVDAHHHSDRHTSGNDLIDRYIHHRRKFVGSYELRDLQYLAFSILGHFLLYHSLVDGMPLILAVLYALLLLLGCETSQRFFYLLCDFLFTQFQRFWRLLFLVLLLAWNLLLSLLILRLLSIVLTALVPLFFALSLLVLGIALFSSSINVDFVAVDTVALFLLGATLSVLSLCVAILGLLAFLAAFSLTLTVWTCFAVQT